MSARFSKTQCKTLVEPCADRSVIKQGFLAWHPVDLISHIRTHDTSNTSQPWVFDIFDNEGQEAVNQGLLEFKINSNSNLLCIICSLCCKDICFWQNEGTSSFATQDWLALILLWQEDIQWLASQRVIWKCRVRHRSLWRHVFSLATTLTRTKTELTLAFCLVFPTLAAAADDGFHCLFSGDTWTVNLSTLHYSKTLCLLSNFYYLNTAHHTQTSSGLRNVWEIGWHERNPLIWITPKPIRRTII